MKNLFKTKRLKEPAAATLRAVYIVDRGKPSGAFVLKSDALSKARRCCMTNFRVITGGKATSNEGEGLFFCRDLALIQIQSEREKKVADKYWERVSYLVEKLGKGKTEVQNKWIYSEYMNALKKFSFHLRKSIDLGRYGCSGE